MVSDISTKLARHRFLVFGVLTFTISSIFFITKTKKKLCNLNSYLNLVSVAYVIYGIILVSQTYAKPYDSSLENQVYDIKFEKSASSVEEIKKLPDIYYIILDSYTSSAALKKYFSYDNNEFVHNLQKRGFYVAETSRSFANSTAISIASTFNMTNDHRLLAEPTEICMKLIENSLVVKYLSSRSYEITNYSLFCLADKQPYYTYFSSFNGFNPWKMLENNLFNVAFQNFQNGDMYKINKSIIFELKRMPEVRQNQPRFIYAHLFIPHEPMILDRETNIIPWWKRKSILDKKAYVEQVQGTNKLVLEVIDNILGKSKVQPVIIIQGDHGYRHGEHSKVTGFSILNAYYLPDKDYKYLYPNVSPFNSFRIIFNLYLKTKYELLKDDYWGNE
ncbi:MAG: hypothetical protein V1747_06560 [Candidatus Omnitrophota bacterium]